MQECTNMRTRTHHRMTIITLTIIPLSKLKIRLTKQAMEMKLNMGTKIRLKMSTKMNIMT